MRKIKIRRVSYVHVLFVINETGVLIVVTKIDFTCHVMDKNITILEQQPAVVVVIIYRDYTYIIHFRFTESRLRRFSIWV